MIDLRLLELAVALDRHRNFGRAAAALGMTQPSFSRGIAALEAAVDARLFDRTNRRVEPTPAGGALLTRARALLADAADLRDAVEDYKSLRTGHLKVGAGPYPLELSVRESVARLARRHPLLQVELIEGQWRDFGPMLLAGEVEVAVMESSIVATDARFRVEELPVHKGCLYCRKGHPLEGRRGLTLGQVLEYPVVGVRLPPRPLAPPSLASRGLLVDPATGDTMPRITTTTVATSRAIVARSDGIGMAVPVQIAEEVRRGELAVLDVDIPTLTTAYGITCLSERSLSPGASAFVALLREVEAEIAGGTEVGKQRRPARLRPKSARD